MVERIKVGDKVKVIAGNDSGKEGEVSLVKEGRAIVKGLGLLVRHRKKNGEDGEGSKDEISRPIHLSNLMPIDSKGKATRTGVKIGKDGTKNRLSKKSGVTF